MTPEEHALPVPGLDGALRVREYASSADPAPIVLLVHGLLATSDIFDVPTVPERSLARLLADDGFRVFSYDQRGAGGSVTAKVDFGMATHAFEDLPAVIEFIEGRTRTSEIHLVCHSMGGLLAYLLRCYLTLAPDATGRCASWSRGRTVYIASPAAFNPEWKPWGALSRQGKGFLYRLDPSGIGIVSRAAFVRAQSLVHAPVLGRLLPLSLLEAAMNVSARSDRLAGIARRAPLPMLIYHEDDFDNHTFRALLDSKALHQAPVRVFAELLEATRTSALVVRGPGAEVSLPDDLAVCPPQSFLTITSHQDRLVPSEAVEAAHRFTTAGRHIVCEESFGIASGHAGYLFKSGLHPRILDTITGFLRRGASGSTPEDPRAAVQG